MTCRYLVLLLLATAAIAACKPKRPPPPHVDVQSPTPKEGRALSNDEQAALEDVAEQAWVEVQPVLPQLPPKIRVVVRWGKNVIEETGENGTSSQPDGIGITLDPDRDPLDTIKKHVRATMFHELHHLVRGAKVKSPSLMDKVITEGLATAFERDVGHTTPSWGEEPPVNWSREVLLLSPEVPNHEHWLHKHPDGRRFIGMRVGTLLVDRAAKASGKTPATMVFMTTDEIVRLSGSP